MSLQDYLEIMPLEQCANEFGVSKPTISRWKSEKNYPEFALIILRQKEQIDSLNSLIQKAEITEMQLSERLDQIKYFFRELIDD